MDRNMSVIVNDIFTTQFIFVTPLPSVCACFYDPYVECQAMLQTNARNFFIHPLHTEPSKFRNTFFCRRASMRLQDRHNLASTDSCLVISTWVQWTSRFDTQYKLMLTSSKANRRVYTISSVALFKGMNTGKFHPHFWSISRLDGENGCILI